LHSFDPSYLAGGDESSDERLVSIAFRPSSSSLQDRKLDARRAHRRQECCQALPPRLLEVAVDIDLHGNDRRAVGPCDERQ